MLGCSWRQVNERNSSGPQIPSPLADAFERAFSLEASKGASRPAALDWLQHLEKSKTDLTPCSAHKEHWFFSKLSACASLKVAG
jgi:DNA-binding helix-hairpin-helix protein with protein kinase domain